MGQKAKRSSTGGPSVAGCEPGFVRFGPPLYVYYMIFFKAEKRADWLFHFF
jgi:hypothetical protein